MANESVGPLGIPPERLINGETAFYTFSTLGYVPFVRNLHLSLLRYDPRLANHLIVFCPDDETERELRRHGMFAINCEADDLPKFAEILRPGFGKVMSYKWTLARRLHQEVPHAWWCDGDVVVNGPVLDRIVSIIQRSDADMIMQYEWPAHDYNCGFWIARRSDEVEGMLADIAEYTAGGDVEDQDRFNHFHAVRDTLTIEALDPFEFQCGNRFYYQRFVRKPDARLLHFNFSFGKSDKESLMMRHQCWYLDAPARDKAVARARYFVAAVALRFGIDFVGGAVGVDLPGPRERLEMSADRVRALLRR